MKRFLPGKLRSGKRRQTRLQPGQFYELRSKVVLVAFGACFCVLAGRAFMIHLFPAASESLHHIAERQYHDQLDLSPYRGSIFDRRKEPLAISIRMPSLFVNPRVFDPSPNELRQLAKLLRLPVKRIRDIAERRNYFAWLKRKVSQDVALHIANMEIPGLFEIMEPARFYPAGTAAAHLLGYVGVDNRGLMGLERNFEENLRGQAMTMTKSRDARGRTIYLQSEQAAPEKAGHNLFLTIDRAVQEITEKALAQGVEKAKAKGGFAIVSDPHTGRILALANYPQFDPNDIRHLNIRNTRNRALTDVFEPGSVVKPYVIAEAIAKGKTRPDEVHDCENGIYREGQFRIRDSHGAKELTTEEVLVESSNICTYKIAKRLGPEALYEMYKKYGFATETSLVEFPGQTIGRISDWRHWRPVRFANVAFGQGFLATGLELVQALGAIANGGQLMKPYVIDHLETSAGAIIASQTANVVRRVMEPETAKIMRRMMAKVVDQGANGNAKMADYTAGGKTGTSEKVDPKTKAYSTNLRIASFSGFAPVEDPYLVIYVNVDEPGVKPYYGATWAAPIFKEIAESSLRYLNVAPDKAPRVARSHN